MFDGPAYTQQCEGGARTKAYLDTRGFWTVGVGCVGADPFHSPDPAIGPHTVWTPEQAALEFARRYRVARMGAAMALGSAPWASLNPVRAACLTDMAYQLGGLGLAHFSRMLAAIRDQAWQLAHDQCLASAYDRETPARCERSALMLLTGQPPTPCR